MSIFKRGGRYQLRRRVPRRYRSIEPRGTIWVSLHTDSETVARSKADRAWSQLTEAWEARLAGDTAAAEKSYEAAQELARIRGFRYLDIGLVSHLPVEALVKRVEAVKDVQCAPDTFEASALLERCRNPGLPSRRPSTFTGRWRGRKYWARAVPCASRPFDPTSRLRTIVAS